MINVRIDNVAELNTETIKGKKYESISYLDIANVIEGRILQYQVLKLENAPSRAQRIIKHNDIIISTVRPNLKHFALIKSPPQNAVASTGFAVISPKKIVPQYLYYFLTTNSVTNYLSAIAENQQSAYPAFNPSSIEKLMIPLTSCITQRKIASILTAYDDLIEINNKRIAILEKMAEELYKEWFVRMRFPGYKEVKFIKGIPEGWEVKRIRDVCKVGRGSSPRPIYDEKYFKDGNIPWIKIADATASKKFIYETKEKVNNFGASFSRLLEKGSLIIATSGTLGFCIFLGIKGCIHDGWLYLSEYNCISSSFLYFVINGNKESFINQSYGAAIQNINTDILRNTYFMFPKQEILDKFINIIEPIDREIDNCSRRNIILTKTRDSLLPRLMSGKLNVENLDIKFSKSMTKD